MLVRLPVFLFILTGINLNQFVDNAIQDSGVKPGSHLYNLFPKMCELLVNSKKLLLCIQAMGTFYFTTRIQIFTRRTGTCCVILDIFSEQWFFFSSSK